VTCPSYRFLGCSLLSKSRPRHIVILISSIIDQAKTAIATDQSDLHPIRQSTTELPVADTMESLDYNNYFAPAPHTFGYLGFGNDATVLGHGAGSDNHGAVEVSLAAI
jgi:hypothetical protein